MHSTSRIDIVLPVYHENLLTLKKNVPLLIKILDKKLTGYAWKIVIAINGIHANEIIALSTALVQTFPERVEYVYVPFSGKGWGVIYAWQKSNANVRAFMDVDLATDPKDIDQLIFPILKNEADIVIGSRHLPASILQRSWPRRIVSTIYNHLFVPVFLGCPLRDLQCGFKAVNRKFVEEILPLVKDREWFFETELLYIAYKKKFNIKEIPVEWVEGETSGLYLKKVIPQFIKKLFELKCRKIIL